MAFGGGSGGSGGGGGGSWGGFGTTYTPPLPTSTRSSSPSSSPSTSTSTPTTFTRGFENALSFLQTYNAPQFAALQGDVASLEARRAQLDPVFAQQLAAAQSASGAQGQKLGNNLNLVQQLMGFGKQSYANLLQGIDLTEQIALRNMMSDATARGAVFTPGTTRRRADITTESGLNRERARIDFEREQAQLATQAKNYGIDKTQLASALQATLARLNLDQIVSVGQILDAIDSKNSQASALASSIVQQAVAMAPYTSLLSSVYPQASTDQRLPGSRVPL